MTKLKLMLAATLLLMPFMVVKSEADALQDALTRGSLRVGVAEENYVPWLASDKSGERIGFEIDVATRVSDALGVPAEFVNVPFDNLLKSLLDGEVDVVISGVSVTAERAKEVYFSTPYATTEFTVVVDKTLLPAGAAENGYDVEGVKIGVAANTVAEYEASSEFQAAEVVSYEDNGLMRDAFLEGEVHGVVAPTPYPVFIVSRDPDRYEMEQAPLLSTVEAMVVRPDSPGLMNFLNAWIVENKASGTLGELNSYWFESGEWLDDLEGYTSGADQTDGSVDGANK
ncbi:transporter substrate-binding domain-containing protein [Roseibium sp.]|uniref:transporter substrate-binding domain-containing protein n=1 Tax=Roseibium sp. TaxID=1936156 RepID=UPI003D127DD7